MPCHGVTSVGPVADAPFTTSVVIKTGKPSSQLTRCHPHLLFSLKTPIFHCQAYGLCSGVCSNIYEPRLMIALCSSPPICEINTTDAIISICVTHNVPATRTLQTPFQTVTLASHRSQRQHYECNNGSLPHHRLAQWTAKIPRDEWSLSSIITLSHSHHRSACPSLHELLATPPRSRLAILIRRARASASLLCTRLQHRSYSR